MVKNVDIEKMENWRKLRLKNRIHVLSPPSKYAKSSKLYK